MIRQDNLTPQTIKKINNFWKWFTDNEAAINKALINFENYEEVFTHLNRNLGYISKRIGYIIKVPKKGNNQIKIIFTAHGYRKLFGKVIGLEQQAPKLPNWKIQAFIKPAENMEEFKQGLDHPFVFPDFELKASELYFSILDYNITQKKIKLIIYLKNYRFHFDNEFLEEAVFIVLQEFIGEIALHKNINFVQMAQLPDNPNKLIHLYELQEYIDKLNRINRKIKI
ncbi:MAG: hypothetical protein K2P85_05690 [Flavobacteriaceae bacterium]|nr:hypothetical protein [Flavobacteriaceae bacterium]